MQTYNPIVIAKSMAYRLVDARLKPSIHFRFRVGGRQFVYCYIRKNACSTFKSFVISRSDERFSPEEQTDLSFLSQHHGVANANQITSADYTFFVYRDPYERLVSLYLNKFVNRYTSIDIENSYKKWTGQDADDASFSDFVSTFCSPPFKAKDPHIRPQARHLFKIRYDKAVPMSGLYNFACEEFGAELADLHFQKPVNATLKATAPWSGDAVAATARQLRQHFDKSGRLPKTSDFADPVLIDLVKDRYAIDYELLQQVS